MAKQRMVNTRFWVDNWISNLDPVEKLLFLYLITNERTNLCGIYELPLKYMAIETGIDKEMVEKILRRFLKEKKVFYLNGWIYLKNAQRYQNLQNESIKLGIEREKSELPAEILTKIKDIDERGGSGIPVGGMSGDTKPNLTKPNLTKLIAMQSIADDIPKIINLFKEISPNSYKGWFENKTERKASLELLKKHKLEDYEALIKNFLPKLNTMPYVGKDCKAFKPSELNRNLDKIITKIKEEKSKVVNNKIASI